MGLKRIAYIEDETDIRTLTEMSLTTIGGFDVRSYATGAKALDDLPDFAPDLIITDVMMPQMNGKELVSRLAEHPTLRTVPTVFITARTLDRDRAELMGYGVAGLISKPFDPLELPDLVRDIWHRARIPAPERVRSAG